MTIKIDHRELCKVLLALTAAGSSSENAEFFAIHDKLKQQLEKYDEALAEMKRRKG